MLYMLSLGDSQTAIINSKVIFFPVEVVKLCFSFYLSILVYGTYCSLRAKES